MNDEPLPERKDSIGGNSMYVAGKRYGTNERTPSYKQNAGRKTVTNHLHDFDMRGMSSSQPDLRNRGNGVQIPGADEYITLHTRPKASSYAARLPTQKPLRSDLSLPDYETVRQTRRTFGSPSKTQPGLPMNPDGNQSPAPRSSSLRRESGANANEVRQSFRSGFTTASSLDHSRTERSSGFTSDASLSTCATLQIGSQEIVEEITVDDVFKMYADGFTEESAGETNKSMRSSPLALRHDASSLNGNTLPLSAKGAERPVTTNSTLSLPSDKAVLRTSTQIMSGRHDGIFSQEIPIQSIKPAPCDRYGFKCANMYVSLKQYDMWNVVYAQYLERRGMKWHELMKRNDLQTYPKPFRFPPRSDKVKSFIRKGIPPEWRGSAWFFYAGGWQRLASNPGVYTRLLEQASNGEIGKSDREHIERDLHRTFPDNVRFKPGPAATAAIPAIQRPNSTNPSDLQDSNIILALRRVLQAFAIHRPKIGYCQSLNFIAGLLLLFLDENEEHAFIMLDILTTDFFPGTHGVALEGANIDIGILMTAVRETFPALWVLIDDNQHSISTSTNSRLKGSHSTAAAATANLPTVSLATTSWFMTLFAGVLPIESTLRVWDCLFYEGSNVLFHVALAIFKLAQRQVFALTDPMEVFQLVHTLPRGMIDANALMEVTFSKKVRTAPLRQEKIEAKRAELRGLEWDGVVRGKGPRKHLLEDFSSRGIGSEPVSKSPGLKRSNTKARIKSAFSNKKTPASQN